jgi:hypothetical protein
MEKASTTQRFDLYKYHVEGQPGFTLSEALRCWKALFAGELAAFERRVIVHPTQHEFRDFVREVWDTVEPITSAEAFGEKNLERRRVFFRCIGVEKLFTALEPELLDRQVLDFDNQRWSEDNTPYTEKIADTYELYRIAGEKVLPEGAGEWQTRNADVFAVRCWCTSTQREYWIYVPGAVAAKKDALEAIAWTIQLDITHPERLYRQGDIMIAKESAQSQPVAPYHLDRDTYTRLLASQT